MDEYLALATMSTRALTAFNVSEFVTSASTTDVMSTSGNETASLGYVMGDQEKQRIFIIAVIMAFTIIGNVTLILVLLCKRSRRIKRVNILLLNLAFGDLAVAMFLNSTEILFIAFGDWALGPIMCKIVVYVQMICLSSATNLLTAMSIDRYQVIVKPMQSLARRPRIWLKIVIAWLLSLLLTLPQLFIFVQHEDGYKLDGTPRRKCSSKGYTASWQRKVNFTFTTTYILIVPMAIMLYCYVKIIRVVWIRAKSESYRRPSSFTPPPPPTTTPTSTTPKTSSDSGGEVEVTQDGKTEMSEVGCGCVDRSKNSEKGNTNSSVRWARSVKDNNTETDTNDNAPVYRQRKLRMPDLNDDDLNPGSPRMSVRRSLVTASKRRALIMTLTVVISFLVCHTPYFFISFIRIYSDYQIQLSRALLVSEFMVMVHSTLNPLLYGLFTLRDYHLKYVIAVLTCSRKPMSPKGLRFRQYSEERHKLLNSVRSRLIHHNPTTGAATITTTSSTNSNNKNSKNKKDRKKDHHHHHHQHNHHHKKAATIAATPTPYSPPSASSASASSTSTTSILDRLRCQPLPYFTRKGRRKRQQQDALLFANKDAIHLTRQNRMRSEETDQTELESLPLTPKDLSPGALIANTHTITSNGSWPTMHNCWKPEVRHLSGSDLRGTTTLPNDSYDVSGGVNAIPWAPQDDEFMIGGLTRV